MTLHSGVTETFVRNGMLELEVTDTGAGMTPAQLKEVFKEGLQFDVNLVSVAFFGAQNLWLLLGPLTKSFIVLYSFKKAKEAVLGFISPRAFFWSTEVL